MYFFLYIAYALDVSIIPSTGTPPNSLIKAGACYDKLYNRIIVFGGYSIIAQSFASDLLWFDLSNNLWGEIITQSYISPPGLDGNQIYLRNDRSLFVFFGNMEDTISSEVFRFNLNTSSWSVETLSGDPLIGRSDYAFCEFEYLNKEYVAIFGGLTMNGVDNLLFLYFFI